MKRYGTTADGATVEEYTLTNTKGASARIINFGATVTHLFMPDRHGKLADVVLAFDNLKPYETQGPYFGSVIGRVANRIAKGKFTLDGKQFTLAANHGPHHLHGGIQGLDKRVWKAKAINTADGPAIEFSILDPDGKEGYPGNVSITMIYTLTNDNALKLEYKATTDKATPVNLTQHSYFNLLNGGASDVLGHVLTVHSDYYTPTDDLLMPTGEIATVKGTPVDFTSPTPIGARIKQIHSKPVGYDHNFVLRNKDGSLILAAEVYEPTTGRVMEVHTTQPAVQFYSGNFLNGIKGKVGVVYNQYSGLCLETQHYPDSVNHPNFPSVILRPGQTYRHTCVYRFSTRAK